MPIYQPTYKDPATGETKKSAIWWIRLKVGGKMVRESTNTKRKTIAQEAERQRRIELERAINGLVSESRDTRVLSVSETLTRYVKGYSINHRPKSVIYLESRVTVIKRHLGTMLLPDLTETAIREYIRARQAEGASGRTVNMEVGELSRAISQAKGTRATWKDYWPNLRKMEERHDVGQALSPEEERRLLDALTVATSPLIGPFVRIALATGMRAGEILSLTWGRVDLERLVITVGKAKTKAGSGRQIPMNSELVEVLKMHHAWYIDKMGGAKPDWYLFPYGKGRKPTDPTKPITDISTAWESAREVANLTCRLHDLRHTAATKMAEKGVPESTMLALMGHMSRAMLERYSHIRMAAKRDAVEALVSPAISDERSKVRSKVDKNSASKASEFVV